MFEKKTEGNLNIFKDNFSWITIECKGNTRYTDQTKIFANI